MSRKFYICVANVAKLRTDVDEIYPNLSSLCQNIHISTFAMSAARDNYVLTTCSRCEQDELYPLLIRNKQ